VNTALFSWEHTAPSYQHASAEAYAAFLREYLGKSRSIPLYLRMQEQFIQAYPNLQTWFEAPLTERIGRVYGESDHTLHMLHRPSYLARAYLYYLVLTGSIRFDWDWLLPIQLDVWEILAHFHMDLGLPTLLEKAVELGYSRLSAMQSLKWVLCRVFLHEPYAMLTPRVGTLALELIEAVRQFSIRPDLDQLYGSVEQYHRQRRGYQTHMHLAHVVLYHSGCTPVEPHRIMPLYAERPGLKPRMEAVVSKYLALRRLTHEPSTVEKLDLALRHFGTFLAQTFPEVETLAQVTREHLLAYAEALETMPMQRTGQPLAPWSKLRRLSCLSVFFRETAAWGWEDIPGRPLLGPGDLPKTPLRVPRYIPADELSRLMQAIRALECPFQRAALLIARWSGARRDEIRRLAEYCLDRYPDGTARLRIPAGKTKRERMVPLNDEAAEAIRLVQTVRTGQRGFRDSYTGAVTHYLFMYHGKLLSTRYLFDAPLTKVCQATELTTSDGKRLISPHRFRHTVGTQLAEKGAKLRTIMSVLGHSSVGMSMVYASISDQEVLKDYQSVLGPGAAIAGPCAEALRTGTLSDAAVDWLKTNFFKTELELGRCLRLPQEGPCECELYLTCAKFVTTPAYAPRLRRRRKREQELVEDALAHGWQREVERHQWTIRRLEQLLTDLGEPIDGPEATE
jgi:site-specific recombinase XerD